MLRKNLLNSKVLKPSSVEPAKQWPRGSSRSGRIEHFQKKATIELIVLNIGDLEHGSNMGKDTLLKGVHYMKGRDKQTV